MSEESAEQKPTLRENADGMNKKRVEMIIDLMFAMCAVVTLVPSSLLEPRYFIVPNTLLSIRRIVRTRMLFSLPRIWSMIVMLLLVNLGLVFVFAELPFERPRDAHMPHDLSPGRFMF